MRLGERSASPVAESPPARLLTENIRRAAEAFESVMTAMTRAGGRKTLHFRPPSRGDSETENVSVLRRKSTWLDQGFWDTLRGR